MAHGPAKSGDARDFGAPAEIAARDAFCYAIAPPTRVSPRATGLVAEW